MYVYIIEAMRTSKKRNGEIVYYTGMSNNPKRRFIEHCNKIKSNWMSRNKIIPRRIVYLEKCYSYEHAIKRERQIKRMPLTEKFKLIKSYSLL